jgi:AcrR family transcriptional regulator
MSTGALKYGAGREALIRAAIDVVAEEGLDAFSYRKVAQRAGVNNTLISHHFGSKDQLLEEATVWAVQRSQQLADLTLASAIDARLADLVTKMAVADPNLQVFQFYMVLAARRSPELQRISSNLYESYIGLMQRVLAHAGYPDDRIAARAVFAALDGLVLQQLTVSNIDEIHAAIVRLGELLAPATRPVDAEAEAGRGS